MSKAIIIPETAGYISHELPQTYQHLFARVATIAGAHPADLLLFGGAVRDALIHHDPYDYDFYISPCNAANSPNKVRQLVGDKKFNNTQMSVVDKPRDCPDQLRLVVYGVQVDLRYSQLKREELSDRAGYALGAGVMSSAGMWLPQDFLDDLKARRLTVRSGLNEASRVQAISKVQLLARTRLKGFTLQSAELA